MNNEINKKDFLNSFLKVVFHFSDKDYQNRVWVNGNGPECDDFEESSMFLSEYGDFILKNACDFCISEKQNKFIRCFCEKVDNFYYTTGLQHPAGDFIDTPEWTHITEMAQEVLKAFNWKPNK